MPHGPHIPFSSINWRFEETVHGHNRIVVYNKADLGWEPHYSKIKKLLKTYRDQKVIFTNARSDDVRAIFREVAAKGYRGDFRYPYVRVLIAGMPNVGKTTLMETMLRLGARKDQAQRTVYSLEHTRNLSDTTKVSDFPTIYVHNTFGEIVPHVRSPYEQLKIAVTGEFVDKVADAKLMADYILWLLNHEKTLKYVQYCKLPGPTDDLNHLLTHIVNTALSSALSSRSIDLSDLSTQDQLHEATLLFLKWFRTGQLGGYILDDVSEEVAIKHLDSRTYSKGHGVIRLTQTQLQKQEWERRRKVRAEKRKVAKI